LRFRPLLGAFIFCLHREPIPAITGTQPAIWRASQTLVEGHFQVFSKTGSCRPVAPFSRAKAEPIAGADGSTGKMKLAFDSDNLSFLGTLQHHDAFNKITLLDDGAVRSALEKLFPSQTFAPRNI
jgi:hypothetical protein